MQSWHLNRHRHAGGGIAASLVRSRRRSSWQVGHPTGDSEQETRAIHAESPYVVVRNMPGLKVSAPNK